MKIIKPVAYTAGAYTPKGNITIDDNIQTARNYAVRLWEMGFAVICPHLNTAHMERDCLVGYEDYMLGDFELVRRSDVIFMIPRWEDSSGGKRERDVAIKHHKPVKYTLQEMAEYLEWWKSEDRNTMRLESYSH